MTDAQEQRTKEGVKATLVGMWINAALTAAKYAAGFLGRSDAMIADATHSLSDLLTDFAVLLGLRYTNIPADEDHAYGHGRIETLAAAFCGLVLLVVGLGIFFEGSASILDVVRGRELLAPRAVALWAALISILFKEGLYRYTLAVGHELQSPSMKANAWHHRTDALSSVGALLGIGGSLLGGPDWAVLDPVAAVVVSVFILHAAVTIFWHSIGEVLDTSLAPSQVDAIKAAALKFPDIRDIHKVRTRRIGFYVAVEAHIVLDGRMSLKRAHDIASNLETELENLLGRNALITLHTEPSEGSVEKVRDALNANGCADITIKTTKATIFTVEDAAKAVGAPAEEILKSLLFLAEDRPMLVLMSGANRADLRAVAREAKAKKVRMAPPDYTFENFGFRAGGVPPTGYPVPMPALLDEDLFLHPVVWAAAGTDHAFFPIEPERLLKLTGGVKVRLKKSQEKRGGG
ncbi:MAG: cation diffusion facilitator family transporter [Synergistaceae bacterium]|jgi:cation diffusion facilitator family transporter|nr:cation diffusion facilitator family transporter [Synergistaceae bacterium]